MSYVPSQSDAIASLYALHFYEINTQMSPSTMVIFSLIVDFIELKIHDK